MKTKLKVDLEEEHHGLSCLVARNPFYEERYLGFEGGRWNGYVAIPKTHPLYGVDYEKLCLDVHGGITFSRFVSVDYCLGGSEDFWLIGFDTLHLDDTAEKWPIINVMEECKKLAKQIKEYKPIKQNEN